MLGFFTVLWYIVQYFGINPRATESLQSRGRAVPELASQWVVLAELSDERHHGSGQKNAHRVEEWVRPWEAAEVYPRASTADQKSGGAWQEPRGNCRVDRRDRWFAASHVLQVGRQSAAT